MVLPFRFVRFLFRKVILFLLKCIKTIVQSKGGYYSEAILNKNPLITDYFDLFPCFLRFLPL